MNAPQRHSICLLSCIALLLALFNSSCGHNVHHPQDLTTAELDSTTFLATHHYAQNFNFVVKSDSFPLFIQQPEEVLSNLPTDSFYVHKNDFLVVADIRIMPIDTKDSVWIQVALNQSSFGWTHESELLPHVVPNDPISQFISIFSDVHLLIFLGIFCLLAVALLVRKLLRRHAWMVFYNDIDSIYPALLTLLVAFAATWYVSIQHFSPETWRHFYFQPTLNPFRVPLLLSIFLSTMWLILIVTIAAIDDILHQLSLSDSILYLCALAGACTVNYIVFSLVTFYYIGYLLLLLYAIFVLWWCFHHKRAKFICGNCGAALHHKGRCPHCSVINQ
ncbi:MAG: zinc ribbon domain-containing protein [Prevotella sp.]|nr:zinc ribbon domain-containing protein [Prevotella sp.]